MVDRLKNEPVALGVLARVVAVIGAKYGLELSVDELLLMLLALETLIGIVTRARVSPVKP